jgi:hypothetical protein
MSVMALGIVLAECTLPVSQTQLHGLPNASAWPGNAPSRWLN